MVELYLRKLDDCLIPEEVSSSLFFDMKEGIYECSLKKANIKDVRSLAQNKLLHGWHNDMSKTTVNEFAGNTEQEWKDLMKYEYLFDMYIELNIKGFAEAILPMIKDYTHEQYSYAKWQLIKQGWITTRDLSIEQFSEYLRKIERYCMINEIFLRTDSYLYELACGV